MCPAHITPADYLSRSGPERAGRICTPLAYDAMIRDDTIALDAETEVKEAESLNGHASADVAASFSVSREVSSPGPATDIRLQSFSKAAPPATPVRMNSIYRYLTQPVNLNRFSWPISGYPSPAIKPEAALPPIDVPPAPTQDQVPTEDSAAPSTGEGIITLANVTAPPGLSTPALIVLAVLLSFALGFMCRTLMMNPEDLVNISSNNNGEALEWTDFRRLLQVQVLGRYLVLGIADRARP